MLREAFSPILMALGLRGGIAIWVLGRPLERVIAGHGKRDSN